jgi:hypothetical protein
MEYQACKYSGVRTVFSGFDEICKPGDKDVKKCLLMPGIFSQEPKNISFPNFCI